MTPALGAINAAALSGRSAQNDIEAREIPRAARKRRERTLGYIQSFIGRLVAEGFASFQGVGDALLSFAFAAEADEGFAFEIEQILFADELRFG